MSKYDVIIVGAGAAGLSAAAILATCGRKVLVLDRDRNLGGRGMAIEFEGYRLNIGGHLLEDPGSGMTKIFEFVGKKLEHGAVSTALPIYHGGKWRHVQELYSGQKAELKEIIKRLVNTDFPEFDKYDGSPLRHWLLKYTSNEGIVGLFEYLAIVECMTEDWWDHSASDNLYVRKMHYQERRIAGYSFWPVGGWDGLFQTLADSVTENGSQVKMNTTVHEVLIENGRAVGVAVEKGPKAIPNEYPELEILESAHVICTLPVWHVLRVVPEKVLPQWYAANIELLAQDRWKACWLGLYVATREPIYVFDPRELTTWLHGPISGLSGWAFSTSALDPDTAPPGVHLFNCGGVYHGAKGPQWVKKKFDEFERGLEMMYPAFNKKNIIWKKRHVVGEMGCPPFGVIQKPYLVGQYRPDYRVPNIDGLYFASETFRSRGIGVDRAARAGLTAAELVLGRRLPEFEDSWHY